MENFSILINSLLSKMVQLREMSELKFIEYLSLISINRTKILYKLHPYIFWLESSTAFHLSLILSVITIIISVFAKVRTVTFLSLQ